MRVIICNSTDCKNYLKSLQTCNLNKIRIGSDNNCIMYEPKEVKKRFQVFDNG